MTTGGLMLYGMLTQRLPGIREKMYRDLFYENGTIIPTQADLEPGAAEVIAQSMDGVGDADIISDGAFDMPLVDLSTSEDRYKVVMIASGFSFTFQQERAENFAGMFATIIDRKMATARRAIAERANKMAAYGDRRINTTGFLNQPGITLNNSSFNPYTSTADPVSDWIIGELEAFHANSNNVGSPSTAVIPSSLWFALIRKKIGDMTLLSYIQSALSGNGMNFQLVRSDEARSADLEANGVQAGGTNKDRMVIYVRDPDVLERHIELPQLMPEEWQDRRAARVIIPMFSCVTPTIISHLSGMRYVDFPKAA